MGLEELNKNLRKAVRVLGFVAENEHMLKEEVLEEKKKDAEGILKELKDELNSVEDERLLVENEINNYKNMVQRMNRRG